MSNEGSSRPDVQVEQLTEEGKPCVLYFGSPHCNVCHAVYPRLMTLVEDLPFQVISIDIAEHPEIAGQFLVFTVPTILVLYEGREILRESRFVDFDKIARILNLLMEANG